MAITDEARNHLFNTLREKLGSEDAATMMDMLPPGGWADVARRDGVDGLQRRFDRLDDRMDRLEAALREQTRFYVMCLFAAIAAVSTIVGIAGL
jgi:ABC-type uncharacterized transport system YnjBCD ATPase subunit